MRNLLILLNSIDTTLIRQAISSSLARSRRLFRNEGAHSFQFFLKTSYVCARQYSTNIKTLDIKRAIDFIESVHVIQTVTCATCLTFYLGTTQTSRKPLIIISLTIAFFISFKADFRAPHGEHNCQICLVLDLVYSSVRIILGAIFGGAIVSIDRSKTHMR